MPKTGVRSLVPKLALGNPGGQGQRAPARDQEPAHHAGPRVLPDEGVPQHLRQLALAERSVSLVLSQGPDALLGDNRGSSGPLLPL